MSIKNEITTPIVFQNRQEFKVDTIPSRDVPKGGENGQVLTHNSSENGYQWADYLYACQTVNDLPAITTALDNVLYYVINTNTLYWANLTTSAWVPISSGTASGVQYKLEKSDGQLGINFWEYKNGAWSVQHWLKLEDLDVTASATELNYTTGVTSPIQTQINTEKATRINADNAERINRIGADTTLQTNINNEVAARTQAITEEATTRDAADKTYLQTAKTYTDASIDALDFPELTATAGTIINSIKQEDGKVTATLRAQTRADFTDAFFSESQVENLVSHLKQSSASIAAEKSRAEDAEATLTSNLSTEIDRATSAEVTLTDSLAQETQRATDAENTLTTDLNTEIARATSAEDTLTADLNHEIANRETAVSNEESRATSAEGTLDERINNLNLSAIIPGTGQIISTISQTNGQVAADVRDLTEADIPALHLTKISDVTSTAAEVNKLDGVVDTVSATQFNQLSGIDTTQTVQTQLNNKEPRNATILKQADVVDNVTSTTTNMPLSANQGKELNDRITSLEGLGRFLSVWNCVTGLPETNPTANPYYYKSGDYYRVGTVAASASTNYKPNGDHYDKDIPSTTVETAADIQSGDVYFYDGTSWILQYNHISGLVTDVKVDNTSTVTGSISNITLSSFNISANKDEINILDGATITTTELNYVDGVTSSIQDQLDDLDETKQDNLTTQTAYTAQGSGTKVAQITTNNLGQVTNITEVDITKTTLSDLGITATSSELNILDGATLSTEELNYVDGVTSSIQTQLDSKQSSLPTAVNDRYLHTNSDTGALEWSEAGKVDDVKVDGTTIVTDKVANIDLATPLATKQNNIVWSKTQPSSPATGDFWYCDTTLTHYPVGGRIFFIDSDNGATYTFYDSTGAKLTTQTVAGLATASTYTITGTPTADKFYVCDTINQWTVEKKYWGYDETACGCTSDYIGSGKINTNKIFAKGIPTDYTPNIWGYIKECRDGLLGGCSDWYVGSKAEIEELRLSGLYPTWFNNTLLTSSESSSNPYWYAWAWSYAYSTWKDNIAKSSKSSVVFAMRSF